MSEIKRGDYIRYRIRPDAPGFGWHGTVLDTNGQFIKVRPHIRTQHDRWIHIRDRQPYNGPEKPVPPEKRVLPAKHGPEEARGMPDLQTDDGV